MFLGVSLSGLAVMLIRFANRAAVYAQPPDRWLLMQNNHSFRPVMNNRLPVLTQE